ncbi:hypothetical protein CONLIGDRAFT_719174 [Coniochaeta ligniaria NRRL 30616]|uniref:Uncharacterized protein n=1 Tax=Coniochaeta ligniaria NRRL 30616 TaxID=1408157 RepID=A0A1J7J303_9PEZI|nr:hypothetical protein CONLIGDRAFT_719174 [Coniochaeta ligniaria NRRL 30616]
MATPQSGQSDEPSFRSYKSLRRGLFSLAAERLFWPLDGVFPAGISVMKTPRSPHDLEPFFQPDTGGSGTGTWHEIAHLPLTEPKVASIEASVSDLDQWEDDWFEWHRDHAAPEFDQEFVTYGDLSDEDRPWAEDGDEDGNWEADSDTEFLIRCCGEDRPLRKSGLKLVVTPSAGNDFVTVHDYVSAVHPWLMSLRQDILKAKTVARPQPYPASGFEWMVDEGPKHKIEEKKNWIYEHGGRPLSALTIASAARHLERIRALRNRERQDSAKQDSATHLADDN